MLDYDETLVENVPDFYEAYCRALELYGSKCPSFEEFRELLKANRLHVRIPEYVKQDEFWRAFRRFYLSRHSTLRRGVREFLNHVKLFGVKVVVVSGRDVHSIEIWRDLERHGIDEYVDCVYTMQDLQTLHGTEEFLFDKSYLIRQASQRYGHYGKVVCIGDYITDYYSCIKAGGIFIGINSLGSRGAFLKKAGVEIVVSDFIEALVALSELGLLH